MNGKESPARSVQQKNESHTDSRLEQHEYEQMMAGLILG